MKAIVYTEYGTPDVLALKDIDIPAPASDEVVVRVHAASVNSWDRDLIRGTPFIVRVLWGLFKPKHQVPGSDIAGKVHAVGEKATRFRPGDEVFGDLCQCGWGGFAEYAVAKESALTAKPPGISFEQAAAIPQAGAMALQGIRDKGHTREGHKVLINGAGGGVGTLGIQLAKSLGAEVTGVDHTVKLEAMRTLGADHVIDYTREDFTKSGRTYDLILDVEAHHSMFDYRRALSPTGRYVMIGGASSRILQLVVLGPWFKLAPGRKKLLILGHQPNKDLAYLAGLCEAGTAVPVIDKTYPLSRTADAFRHFGTGEFIGKVLIAVLENESQSQ